MSVWMRHYSGEPLSTGLLSSNKKERELKNIQFLQKPLPEKTALHTETRVY